MKKKVLLYLTLFCIFLVWNLLLVPLNLDEVWNYGFAHNIYSGLIPYKDFNMIDNNSVIIGHSTGSICALKYVLENKIKIDKLILVSGFNDYLAPDKNDVHNKVNPTYYVEKTEIKEIKNYVNEIICIYGDDDPFIPQDVLHKFAESIDAKEVIIKKGGHLNADSGYTEFTELLKYA